MDSVSRIEELILGGSEGFFDEPNTREDLHVTVRIARDVYDFLKRYGENPSAKEIDYITGTIRSGVDELFALAYQCVTINTGRDSWSFDSHVHWDFPALRERFLRDFEHLSESREASAAQRLVTLLNLGHLELVLLAHHFPSAIFENVARRHAGTGRR
ncbi:MAG TPA: hypothetical protein VFA76_03785 [Terriglobales bacterium]|nr:hypothetical protein [Terriglobales bacterium]